MGEECLICGAPLKYTTEDFAVECAICKKKEYAKVACINGHYVCNDCHTQGMENIFAICLRATSSDPIAIIKEMMSQPFCHMHGPEHHVMVGAALLTAYKNAGGEIDLYPCLTEMYQRGKTVPGGVCGFWGACGAAISSGIFVSIISNATPLSQASFGLANQMTARSLEKIGKIGGPRCCKRDSYFAISEAILFVKEHFGVQMQSSEIICTDFRKNSQCIGKYCPFFHK